MRSKNKKSKVEHRHTGIVVNNLRKQLEFYRDLLGLEVYYSKVEKGSFVNKILGSKGHRPLIYKLGSGGKNIVELLYFEDAEKSKAKKLFNTGFTHFAITVKDLDKLYLLLKEKSVKFVNTPEVSPDGLHKVVFCQDFDGNFIELVEVIKDDNRNNARKTKSASKRSNTRVSK